MTIGEKIQKLRKEQNLSQEELAGIVGVSRQALSKWECDTSLPDLDKIIILSEHFKVTTDYLLKEQTENPAPQPAENSHVNPNSTLAFTTIITAVGFITAFAKTNDGSIFLHWDIPDAMWGFIIQIIGVGLFEMFFFGYNFKKRVQLKFWCINSWILTFMPIIFLAGFVSNYFPCSSLLYIIPIAGAYLLFNIILNLILIFLIKKV